MEEILYSPIAGVIKDNTECADNVFAEKMLGDGIMIIPASDTIVSPCDGEVITVSNSKHAITMRSKQGYELMIHIGIDTVALNGAGFTSLVQNNQQVAAGQKIMQVDFNYVKKHGYNTSTMLIIISKACDIQKEKLNKEVIQADVVLKLSHK